jgi:hypothetical protein
MTEGEFSLAMRLQMERTQAEHLQKQNRFLWLDGKDNLSPDEALELAHLVEELGVE